MTQAQGLVATTLRTAVPDAPKTPEAGSIGVCVEGRDLCVVIFADHGRQQIVARLSPAQADYFAGLVADALVEVFPVAFRQHETAQGRSGTLQ